MAITRQLTRKEFSAAREQAMKEMEAKGIDINKQLEVQMAKSKKTKKATKKTSTRLQQVKAYLAENPKAKGSEVCKALKLHPSYYYRLVKFV